MRMRLLRRLLGSRAHVAAMAVLALALQAGSSGYVQACPMKMQTMTARHACCQAAKACHMPGRTQRKACCFFGVMSPCADGAVSELAGTHFDLSGAGRERDASLDDDKF